MDLAKQLNRYSPKQGDVMTSAGFDIKDNILSSAECDELISLLADVRRGRAGARNLMKFGFVSKLASDSRLLRLTELIYGRELVPYKATLFEKTGKANWLVAWHQDTALPIEKFVASGGWSAPSMKAGTLFAQAPSSELKRILALRIHLDGSTETNGPLRVIPGSHSRGILADEIMKELVSGSEPIQCLVGRGGVIAMSPLLLHSSSKIVSNEPRRVVHIEYAESLDLGEGMKLAIA